MVWLCLLLITTGCAAGAKPGAMTVHGSALDAVHLDATLEASVDVAPVTGGSDTYMMLKSNIGDEAFRQALVATLRKCSLYAEDGPYELTARIDDVDQPFFGMDLTVTTRVHYLLKDRDTGRILLDEHIVADGTATIGDSFVAVKRLRLANEKSAQENIRRFIEALGEVQVDVAGVETVE